MSKNIMIFRPKRKYNQPRYAKAVAPNESFVYKDGGIVLSVTNTSKKTIYIRKASK